MNYALTVIAVPDSGRHGMARLDAVTAIVEALGCRARSRDPLSGRRDRTRSGDYLLTVDGPRPVIRWLNRTHPSIIARLDEVAAEATRRYGQWLRDGCPDDDHMPADRPALRARWRREYLRAYAAVIAGRIRGIVPAVTDPRADLYRAHRAWQAGGSDAGRASLADYIPRPARSAAAPSPLLVAVPARPRAIRPADGGRDRIPDDGKDQP